MLIISHRGNTKGKDPETENNPKKVQELLNKNIHVEIDVWNYKKNYYLGHDEPVYKVDKNFLIQKNLWCHAKNIKAFKNLLNLKAICFWHQEDDYTLTSNGFIWTYPHKNVTKKSIIVDLDKHWINKNYKCYGVCVDYL